MKMLKTLKNTREGEYGPESKPRKEKMDERIYPATVQK
jgi:hypothetical protein